MKHQYSIIAAAMSAATGAVISNTNAASHEEATDTLFSMESFSINAGNFRAVTDKLAQVNQSKESIADSVLVGFTNAVKDVIGEDENQATIEAANMLFGGGFVSSMLAGEGGFAKVEKLLKDATNEAAQMCMLLNGDTNSAVKERLSKLSSVEFSMESASQQQPGYIYDDSFSLESFDNFDPNRDLTINMMLASLSVVEAPVCRLTYPTYRLQPGQNVITMEIDRDFLQGNNLRNRGKGFKREDTPLLDAYWNTDLFDDNRTECIPVYTEETKAAFVDPALFGLRKVKDENGELFDTGMLKFGHEVDYIAISGNRGEIKNRRQDRTDQLDPAFSLAKVGFKVTTGKDATLAVDSFSFTTSSLLTALRTKDTQGGSRVFSIKMHENILIGKPTSMKSEGQAIAGLENIFTQYTAIAAELTVTVPAVDLTEATSRPTASIFITGLRDSAGNIVPKEDPAVAALLEDVVIEPQGYELSMRRTDTNFTNTGKEVLSRSHTQQYPIGFSPRILHRSPMNSSDLDQAKHLDAVLSKVTREKVIKQLANKFERLYAATDGGKGVVKDVDMFNSKAFGNIVTIPTLRYAKYAPTNTQTISHAERLADVRSHVVQMLRTQLAFAVDESRLRAVARDLNNGKDDIRVSLICDPIINNLLMVEGDERMLTTAFSNFEIAEDNAPLFKNRVMAVFHVDTSYDISPVSNGLRAVGVSPVVKIDPDQSNGAKLQSVMIEPREAIIDTNEIMVVLEVEDLDKIMDVTRNVVVTP